MKLPQSWNDIDVYTFKDIRSLNTIEEPLARDMEIMAVIMDVSVESLDDYDISDLNKEMKKMLFLNSEPSKIFKNNIHNYIFKPFELLTCGEFIDLEYYFSNDYIKHISHIAAIVYKKHKFDEWGNLIYEPYTYNPNNRSEEFDNVCVNDIYGIIPSYLNFRKNFLEKYMLLFEDDPGPEEEDKNTPLSKEDQEHKSAVKWGWERLIYSLCNEDLTKFEEATNLPLILAFNMMSMKKDLSL